MKRYPKLYTCDAVDRYLAALPEDTEIITLTGSMVDNYVIRHPSAVEIFAEKPLNCWGSGTERHVYRKKVPAQWIDYIKSFMDYEPDATAAALEACLSL